MNKKGFIDLDDISYIGVALGIIGAFVAIGFITYSDSRSGFPTSGFIKFLSMPLGFAIGYIWGMFMDN